MQPPLRIGLCGGLAVELAGNRIEDELSGRQGRELFAYLVLNRGRPVSRDELMALLWPDRPPRSPEAALNTILARLRRALGHGMVAGRAQLTLELPDGAEVDLDTAQRQIAEAEALLQNGDPAQALAIATAAADSISARLLPEVQHAWVDPWRGELDDLSVRALSALARAGLAVGGAGLADAERAARRLIEREPFRESGYALLMEVQAARGDTAQALLVYERLRKLLRDELGIPPSAQVAALHERLLTSGEAATPASSPTPAPSQAPPQPAHTAPPLPDQLARAARQAIVGRAEELSELNRHYAAIHPHERLAIALAGEPGIGKTTLAAAFALQAHADGATVLYGQAHEESLVPYAPLVEALRHYVRATPRETLTDALGIHVGELGWLVPELADLRAPRQAPASDPRLERMRLYQAVAALLTHAAAGGPLVIVLEDLQCADGDTLLMIRQLLREPAANPVLALLTYRDVEVGPDHPLQRLLAELRRDPGVVRLHLRGLDEAALADLLRHSGGTPSDDLLVRIREHTSGNPLFVHEVLAALRETRPGVAAHELSADDVVVLPDAVQDVIAERLRRLEQPARDVLAAAAVLGQVLDAELLESMLDPDAVGDGLDAAQRAGLLVPTSGHSRYAFGHALAREAIYRGLGRGRRTQLHMQAAQAIERRAAAGDGRAAAALAHHYVESDRSDVVPKAIAYSRQAAAGALAAHAYEDAAHHYGRALELIERHAPGDQAARCELLLALGDASWRGSGARARVIFEQALSLARGLGEHARFAEAALGLGGRFYAPTGPDEPYVQLLEEALQFVGEDEGLRARMLARLAENVAFTDPVRAAALSEESLATARRLGDQRLVATTLLSRHAALLHVSHLPDRLALAREQVAVAHAEGDPELEALGNHWLLYDLLEIGDLEAARAAVDRQQELAGELRQPLYRHSTLVWRRVLELLAGRFERAAQLAHEALNLAEAGHGEDARRHFLAQQLLVLRDHGEPARVLGPVRERARAGEPLWTAALLALEAELTPEAAAPLPDVAAIPHDGFWLSTLAVLVEAHAAGGRADQTEWATGCYEQLAPYADRFVQIGFYGSLGSVHRHLGLLAAALGRRRVATEHFEAAITSHAALGAPALEARAWLDYARALLGGAAAGSKDDVPPMAAEAARLAGRCGATRLQQQIAALGLQRVPV